MYDARAIANLMLCAAERHEIKLTQIALQKLLFFVHAIGLVEGGKKLFAGDFEAWTYGPVHPAVYQAFKAAGSEPIEFRAQSLNPVSRELKDILEPDDPDVVYLVERVLRSLGRNSPGRLVAMTHAKGGPWSFTVEQAKAKSNVGLRISDDAVRNRYRNLKILVKDFPEIGEPDEDTPFI